MSVAHTRRHARFRWLQYLLILTILTLVRSHEAMAVSGHSTSSSVPIRILTHNIRYATSHPDKGEKPWTERKQLLLSELHYHTLGHPEAFVCMQEVLDQQLRDILAGLNTDTQTHRTNRQAFQQPVPDQARIVPSTGPSNEGLDGEDEDPEWAYIGVGRNDGLRAGEYSPILYRPSAWDLSGWRTVWLSPTPEVPGSVGWDAAQTRIVTVGRFRHRESGRKVVGFCTHFDDQGVVARRESARLLVKIIEQELEDRDEDQGEKTAVWLAGDLNSRKEEGAYRVLNGEADGAESMVRDVEGLRPRWRYGDVNTFTGFRGREKDKQIIDFVFVGPVEEWEVEGYTVVPNLFEEGGFVSDHRAVVADLKLVGRGDDD